MAALGLQGTLLGYGGTPTTIVGRVELDGPETDRVAVKTTDLDTTVAHTFRPSQLYDGGSLTGTLFYDPAQATHIHLQTDITGAAETWTLTYSDGSKFSFSGFLTKFKPLDSVAAGDEDNLKATFEIKVSGAITFTVHS
jgi:hypothetical protein